MIIQSDKRIYNSLEEILHGSKNDVFLCEDISHHVGKKYIIWIIHDMELAKYLLSQNLGEEDRFVFQNELYIVWDDHFESWTESIKNWLLGWKTTGILCEKLILACINSQIPCPILTLLLEQGKIKITSMGTVWISHELDLQRIQYEAQEKEVAMACAGAVLEALEDKRKKGSIGYILVEKKLKNHLYETLPGLYQDIQDTKEKSKATQLIWKCRSHFQTYKDNYFRIVYTLGCVFGVITIVAVISEIMFGRVFIYQIMDNTFKQIGTIDLTK